MLSWLDTRAATDVGTALADDFVMQSAQEGGASPKRGKPAAPEYALQKFLQRVDREVRSLSLNLLKRAKLANSFKWRLLEKGVEKELAEELTRMLVHRVTIGPGSPTQREHAPASSGQPGPGTFDALMRRAGEHTARGANAEAVQAYEEALRLDPRNAVARNNLGVALGALGRYSEAGQQFRQAIGIREGYPDAQFNLGTLLRTEGHFAASEQPLRRALKLKPKFTDAQVSLAATLFNLGRLSEARQQLEGALESVPRHVEALQTMGELLARQGHFAEAEGWFKRALETDPNSPRAWVGLGAIRRLSAADGDWLKGAQHAADSGLAPLNEANLRYSIGKYYDEVGEFGRAFKSYQRANQLVKTVAEDYDREARSRLADDLIHAYPREVLTRSAPGQSDSTLPVLVIGMPRSGTTLIMQIIAAHPAAKSAGELEFWTHAVLKNMPGLRNEAPAEGARSKLAEKYLRALTEQRADAPRIVDKSPFNSDYLGVIHSVFPRARTIYVERDPIDTCLSCYFQDFPPTLNFTQDLADLAHYYREHRRLVEHWRSELAPESLLTVPYEALIADQVGWTRRIVEFLGLPWDEQCLNYQNTAGSVLTASFWQVRQKLYQSSIGRWRHYEKFIGPLLELRSLG